MGKIKLRNFFIGEGTGLVVLSGPCIIESEDHCLRAAEELKKIFASKKIPLIFKSSFDKANRSSINSFRGPGLEEGLRILEKVKTELDLPVITDIHSPEQAAPAAEVCEVIQIPAFLCRQTDLLIAAAKTPAIVNVKKGQFMAPWDMENVVDKIRASGNNRILLTDRGTTFGYNNLVSDFRALPIMKSLGVPVCYDASHSVQLPGGNKTFSGGQREFIPTLTLAALAAGADCIFIESHPNPSQAKSDAATVYPFAELPKLLDQMIAVYQAVNSR